MDVQIAAAAVLLVAALIGALAGSAGFAFLSCVARTAVSRASPNGSRRAEESAWSPSPTRADPRPAAARRLPRPRRPRGRHLAARHDRPADRHRQPPVRPRAGRRGARPGEPLPPPAVRRDHLDLDHFKRLNDAHGHAAGDVVLRHVGQLLAANVRAVDIAGRYGGEEFLVVLPETDPDAAASLAEKLRRDGRRRPGPAARRRARDGHASAPGSPAASGERPGARRAGPRRRRRAVLGQGAGPRPGLRLPRDRRRRARSAARRSAPRRARGALDVGRSAMDAAQDALLATLAGRGPWPGSRRR